MTAATNGAASSVDATVAKLLNFAEPLDVALLDSTVNAFYGAGSNEQVRFHLFLLAFVHSHLKTCWEFNHPFF